MEVVALHLLLVAWLTFLPLPIGEDAVARARLVATYDHNPVPFASLGLPAFSGFIAEFQIFAGAIGTAPVTAVALLGILLTAAMFLLAVQRIFAGKTRGGSIGFRDLSAHELWPVGSLLALSLLIGVLPRVILDVIEPAAATLVDLVGR